MVPKRVDADRPQLDESDTHRIGLKHLGRSGPDLVSEVCQKRNEFLIKFVSKVFTFSSGGYVPTL